MDFQKNEIKEEFNEQVEHEIKIEYQDYQSESDLSDDLRLKETPSPSLGHIKQEPELILESDELPAPDEIVVQTKPENPVIKRLNFNPTRCYICKHNFKDEASLEIHLPLHTDMIPYVCEECTSESAHPTKLTSLGPLHRHFRLHATNFKCPKCPKWVQNVQRHVRDYHNHNDKNPQFDYSCKICGKISKSKAYYEKHQLYHKKRKERRFICSFCNKKLKSKVNLVCHERCHTGERPFQCKYCPKVFKTKQNIESHERIHTGEKGFRCNVCCRDFRTNHALQGHMINIHGRSARNKTGELVESAVTCQEADEIKGQSVYVKQGLDSTSETNKMLPEQGSINEGKIQLVNQFKCYICEQVFNDCESRDTHLSTHLDMLPYKCVKCSKESDSTEMFISMNQLHRHLQLHAHNMKCPQCPFWTSTSELLTAHINEKHTKKDHSMKYTCQICGKQFTKSNFTKHMRNHKDRENGRFTCAFCGAKFCTKWDLIHHERNHTNEHPYQCRYCPKTLKTKGILERHERTHTGERPYSCQTCDKTFGWLKSLRAHIEASHTAMVYKCELEGCDFTTPKRSTMDYHTARHEMRHVCSFCTKRFPCKSALATHELIHLGIKDFHCKQCAKSFRTKSALNNHVKLHNDIRPFVCKTCGTTYVQKVQLQNHLTKNVQCQNADQMEFVRSKSG
ncbi:zinc finger protein 888 isoform X2 [Aedes albopictus]